MSESRSHGCGVWFLGFILLLGIAVYFFTGTEAGKRLLTNVQLAGTEDSFTDLQPDMNDERPGILVNRLLFERTRDDFGRHVTGMTAQDLQNSLGMPQEVDLLKAKVDGTGTWTYSKVANDPATKEAFDARITIQRHGRTTRVERVDFRLAGRVGAEHEVWSQGLGLVPGSEDDVLTRRLIGPWEGTVSHQDSQVSGTETFLADGTFTFTGTLTGAGRTTAGNFGGTWRIEGKTIHVKLTYNSFPGGRAVGSVDADEIVKLTDTELTIRDSGVGTVETYRRVSK